MSAETGAPVFSERALSFFWWSSWSQMVVRLIRGSVYLQPYVVNGTWGPIGLAGVQLGSKTRRFIGFFQRSGGVKATESAFVMERAMEIEPTSQAWEVLNSPIPFSSQRDARPLVSVNRWASKAHPVRPTPFTSVGRVGQLATASRKLRRQASRVLALYDR